MTQMVNTSRCMRCYVRGTSGSPLVQFSSSCEDSNDNGDGDGIQVFAFLSIPSFGMYIICKIYVLHLPLYRVLLNQFQYIV